LIDVNETNGGIHQEIDFVEEKGSVAVQRFDIARHLLGIIDLRFSKNSGTQ